MNPDISIAKAPEPLRALTPTILKGLPFGLKMHINGGRKFSVRTVGNDEYGLFISTTTDGSPNYRVTEKRLSAVVNESIVLDLTKRPVDWESFCKAYNAWKGLSERPDNINASGDRLKEEN